MNAAALHFNIRDYAQFHACSEQVRDRVIAGLFEDLTQRGFTVLINCPYHGPLLQSVRRYARTFHDLPDQIKDKYYSKTYNKNAYHKVGDEKRASDGSNINYRDFLTFLTRQPLHTPADPHQYRQSYDRNPDLELPGYTSTMDCFLRRVDEVTYTIMQGIAIAMGRDPDLYHGALTFGSNDCRLNRSHFHPGADPIGAHYDSSIITQVMALSAGLEVNLGKNKDSWKPVWAGPESTVIFAGLTLWFATGGVIKSPLHRVVEASNAKSYRDSINVFCAGSRQAPMPLTNLSRINKFPSRFQEYIHEPPLDIATDIWRGFSSKDMEGVKFHDDPYTVSGKA